MAVQPLNIEDFGRGFQVDLFHELIVDPRFGESVISMLEPKHFNVEAYQKLIVIIKKYYEKHEVILNFPNLRTEINIQVAPDQVDFRTMLLDTVQTIEDKIVTNKNVQDRTIKFCKLQSLRSAVNSIKTKLDKGIVDEYDTIEKTLKDALIFKEVEDAIEVYHDIDSVLSDDFRDPIPTGVKGIDELLSNNTFNEDGSPKGGLSKGELALVIAPLGVGKTTWLTKVANSGYMSGKNVLQIFFEDKEKDIQRKHYTIMSEIPLSLLNKEETREIVKRKVAKIHEEHPNNHLFLQKLPADGVTLIKIKNIIKKLNSKGTKIDLLVIDYIDCISMEKEYANAEEWSNEGKIMRQLETLVEEMDVACWTATQGNRSSTSIEVVKTENMGGSLKKAQIAHFIMSIGKVLEQKENKTATISILKNRLGPDGMIFQSCAFNNDKILIDTDDSISESGFEASKIERKQSRLQQVYKEVITDKNKITPQFPEDGPRLLLPPE